MVLIFKELRLFLCPLLFNAVYANALLATLNARPYLREQVQGALISFPLIVNTVTTAIRGAEPTNEPGCFPKDSGYATVRMFTSLKCTLLSSLAPFFSVGLKQSSVEQTLAQV